MSVCVRTRVRRLVYVCVRKARRVRACILVCVCVRNVTCVCDGHCAVLTQSLPYFCCYSESLKLEQSSCLSPDCMDPEEEVGEVISRGGGGGGGGGMRREEEEEGGREASFGGRRRRRRREGREGGRGDGGRVERMHAEEYMREDMLKAEVKKVRGHAGREKDR